MLQLELNRLRHMIIDISCLDKDLDLRLMLCSKRSITILTVSNSFVSGLLDFNALKPVLVDL